MKNLIFYTIFLGFAVFVAPLIISSAGAQPQMPNIPSPFSDPITPPTTRSDAPQVVDNAQCFVVRNMMENSIYGLVSSEAFTRDDGITTRHRATFKLFPAGKKDDETGHALDVKEFCTTGPFFEGNKMNLELKTLFPIFSCLTRIDQGEILVLNTQDSDGDNKIIAKCFE